MTPQEHNKFVGIAHLAYAGFHVLTTVLSLAILGFMFQNIYSRLQSMGGPPPPPFLGIIFVLAGIFNVVMTIPPYALLKRRSWAKIAGIVSGVVAALSFPIGTAVAVYTFWFLFGDSGKQLYGRPNQELPPLPPKEWELRGSDSVEQPRSASMPDWR